ncbi:MAG: alpha/beta fold hydrolase [Ktedonobacterales bacterium]
MESKENRSTDALPPAKPEQRDTVPTIHYRLSYLARNVEHGPQSAIVLLHDLPGGAFTWIDALPKLGSTARSVYALDLLGYGESDRPWPSDTSIWGHADSLSYAFKHLGLTQIVLVGFGLGGAVAQVLATRLYREQIAKLVLIDSYAYQWAFAPNWPLPEMEKRQDPEAAMHTPIDQMLGDLRKTLPVAAANTTYLAGSKLDAYINEWNSNLGKNLLFQHIRLMNSIYMNSVASDLRLLDIPVLLIWGDSDQVTPLSLGQRMQSEIPEARLEILRSTGHLVLDEAPEAVGGLIADFAGNPTLP